MYCFLYDSELRYERVDYSERERLKEIHTVNNITFTEHMFVNVCYKPSLIH